MGTHFVHRIDGYYWVKFRTKVWQPAYWDHTWTRWMLVNDAVHRASIELDAIGDPIRTPDMSDLDYETMVTNNLKKIEADPTQAKMDV
jgi:hypothetical protein